MNVSPFGKKQNIYFVYGILAKKRFCTKASNRIVVLQNILQYIFTLINYHGISSMVYHLKICYFVLYWLAFNSMSLTFLKLRETLVYALFSLFTLILYL